MKAYKYRGLVDFERDIGTLTKNQLFASPFDKLNDPFEGVYDENISQILEIFETIFKVDSAIVKERFKAVTDYKTKLGIYSLSMTYLDELLWAHYADSHKGFCIEYDLNKIKDNYLTPKTVNELLVDYKESPPTITPNDFNSSKVLLKKLFATKSTSWKYEKEIRLIFDSSHYKSHHPSALTGIYFGADMLQENKDVLFESLKNRDIYFYELNRVPKSYKLKSHLIHET